MSSDRQTQAQTHEEAIKETFESIIIAFIFAFVFRAYVVEAFVIPTGSMAPTLLGQHLRVTCVQCGYGFTVDPDSRDLTEIVRTRGGNRTYVRPYVTRPPIRPLEAVCPMCHFSNVLPYGTRVSDGDRILVQKYIYHLAPPRRWDVIVFKAPHDPDTNYIKRLVGLPNEQLAIVEGNIYTQPLARDGAQESWRIARKTDRPAVQRAVWQPLYDSLHYPLDAAKPPADRRNTWFQPWQPGQPQPSNWQDLGRNGFRYTASVQQGQLSFSFPSNTRGGPGLYVYNQFKDPQLAVPIWPRGDAENHFSNTFRYEPVEDVRISVTVQPDQPGLTLMLQTTARLDDAEGDPQLLVARLEQGQATLTAVDPVTRHARPLASTTQSPDFSPGRSAAVELWYADQEASLWVDGEKILSCRFDLPFEAVLNRKSPQPFPGITIGVAGSPATLHRVRIDRDLYYGSYRDARGGIIKNRRSPRGYNGQPTVLEEGQFFCFGDNSPLSADSRYWDEVNPWVRARMFDATNAPYGIVPRQLVMGRAFFVYFPAPYRAKSKFLSWLPVPNFGGMRFIH